jgi:hypothetical protein
MQEALQNPHFKKIWEKVIMNRHHGVESLEEALEMELKTPFCTIYLDNGVMYCSDINGKWDINKERVHRYYDGSRMNGLDFTFDNSRVVKIKQDRAGCDISYYELIDEKELITYHLSTEDILGRLITLEDIFMIKPLSYYLTLDGNYQNCFKYDSLTSGYSSDNYNVKVNIDWQLRKYLHEQTPETWEKIANLI